MKKRDAVLKLRHIYALSAIAAFAAGTALYLLFRQTANLVFFDWFNGLNRAHTPFIALNTTEWTALSIAAYNMPDGLWLLSGICAIRAVWLGERQWCARYTLGFCILALFLETTQLWKNVPGTFDILDITALSAATIIEGIVYTYFVTRRFENEN
jgi:hypothetical protein